jgi:GNAT superfamily N-acetyltransferase
MAEFYAEAGYPLRRDAAAGAFARLLDDPRLGRVWLVEGEEGPVGYLVLTLAFSMEFGGLRGFIDDFFVRPTARGKGFGGAALAAVRQHCDELGVRALLVETGPEGHPARRLYARAGFKESGRVFLTQALASAVHEP